MHMYLIAQCMHASGGTMLACQNFWSALVRIHATVSAFNSEKQQSKPDIFPLNLNIA